LAYDDILTDNSGNANNYYEHMQSDKTDWKYIDSLVVKYQKKFNPDSTPLELEDAELASIEILKKFYPLLKKFASMIKTGEINFNNYEQCLFVALFLEDVNYKMALYGVKKKAIPRKMRIEIHQRFNFVKETYGYCEIEDIMTDMRMLLLVLAKRYKVVNKSFCCYVAYAFRYEVFRHIQVFTRNPLNIHYKNVEYQDSTIEVYNVDDRMENIEDHIYENSLGLPDMTWISGLNCSEVFKVLTPLERKIMIMYYLEFYCDKQISAALNIHVNICNLKRREAVKKIADYLEIPYNKIKRSRNSGKKAY